jgi:hypothetical protein
MLLPVLLTGHYRKKNVYLTFGKVQLLVLSIKSGVKPLVHNFRFTNYLFACTMMPTNVMLGLPALSIFKF